MHMNWRPNHIQRARYLSLHLPTMGWKKTKTFLLFFFVFECSLLEVRFNISIEVFRYGLDSDFAYYHWLIKISSHLLSLFLCVLLFRWIACHQIGHYAFLGLLSYAIEAIRLRFKMETIIAFSSLFYSLLFIRFCCVCVRVPFSIMQYMCLKIGFSILNCPIWLHVHFMKMLEKTR